ncbi:YolD-like family protein [Staphylococcus haemolyticus]|uniref:YolD-like family protein n=1 Tax=Staphylococcus haemolyticus TaxID=1283 RepID=UPI00069D93B2|nr:YolD-like family protein [Staphylococcus haemolyticus]
MKPLPDEYKNETDYRKIPREYLDQNIPQGRGKIKWQAFKTIPEQYEILSQYVKDQNKVDMPSLSFDQIDDINTKLNYYLYSQTPTTIHYWQDGYINSIFGYIKSIDTLEKFIKISNEQGNQTRKLEFKSICEIE